MTQYYDAGTEKVETIAEASNKASAVPVTPVVSAAPNAASAREGMTTLQNSRRARMLEHLPSINE